MSGRRFLSGHCNPSNPPSSHGRCRVVCEGRPCACPCHGALQALRSALVDVEAAAPAVAALLAGPLAVWWQPEVRGLVRRLVEDVADLVEATGGEAR